MIHEILEQKWKILIGSYENVKIEFGSLII